MSLFQPVPFQISSMKQIVIFIIAVAFLSACNLLKRKPAFTVVTPGGWKRKDTVARLGDSLIRFSPVAENDSVSEKIVLLIVHYANPDEYRRSMIQKLKGDAETFEVSGEGSRLVDDVESKWVQIAVKYKTAAAKVDQRMYFVPKNGFIYLFICTVTADEYELLRPKADDLINSLKIL
jgi:hypothetical protein